MGRIKIVGSEPTVFGGLVVRESLPWWLVGGLSLLGGVAPLLLLPPETRRGIIGSPLELWENEGTGPDATAAGAARPTMTATGVDFNGAAHFMTAAGLTSASTDYTACFVVEPDDTAGSRWLLGTVGSQGFMSADGSAQVGIHDGTALRSGMRNTTRLQMLTYVVKAAGTLWEVYRDGILLATGATYDGTLAWGATPTLGAAHGGGSGRFDGEIRFACVFASALSAGNLATLHSVVGNRFGIAFYPWTSVAGIDAAYLAEAQYLTLVAGNVTQWNDVGGNNYHLTVPAGKNAPAWNAALGRVDFDRANSEGMRVVIAGRTFPTTVIYDGIIDRGDGATRYAIGCPTVLSGLIYNDGLANVAAWSGSSLGIGAGAEERHRWAYVALGGAGSSFAKDDGVPTTGTSGATDPGDGIELGMCNGVNHSDSSCYAAFVYKLALNSFERTAVNDWLVARAA